MMKSNSQDNTAVKLDPVKLDKLRFGAFEVDFKQRELRKHGLRLHLQPKPFQILEMLLERPGNLITRDEIARRLWPHSQVSVDHSLNTAVNSLRQALNDSTNRSHLIETRSGLGYVFLASVERISSPASYGPARFSQDYLTGRYLLDKMTEEDAAKSIAYFESALLEQDRSALALSGLADAWCEFARLAIAPVPKAAESARNYAIRALSANSELAESHISMAAVKMLFDGDLKSAESEYLRALKISPASAAAHRGYGLLLQLHNNYESASHHLTLALDSDPLSRLAQTSAAWHLYQASDFEGAAARSWQILAVEARLWQAQLILALSYRCLGMTEEAAAEASNAVACSHRHPVALAALAFVDPSQASTILAELASQSARRHVPAASFALAYQAAGNHLAAGAHLDRAIADRDCFLHWLLPASALKPVRLASQPAFV